MSDPTPPPASPRSPRPTSNAPALPTLTSLPLPASTFVVHPQPPRPSLGSMLFLTAFFFFMSGNNNMPEQTIMIGPDGDFIPRVTELSLVKGMVEEYTGFLNGTGNWTEPEEPKIIAANLIPSQYHFDNNQPFYQNITGFHRLAQLHPLNLLDPSLTTPSFFETLPHPIPNINDTTFNSTLATLSAGTIPLSTLSEVGFNFKERVAEGNVTGYNWVKGSMTLSSDAKEEVEYEMYGVHHVEGGKIGFYGLPKGMRIDIRKLAGVWEDEGDKQVAREIVKGELERELRKQMDNLMMMNDVQPDTETDTTCPIIMQLQIPPLPHHITSSQIELYESELADPTGIGLSLPRPPHYWEVSPGLGGVIIADGCGWAYGISGGTGVPINDFWRKSLNYAAYATVSQLIVLLLLVRQMESTRTPSTLSKVSLWTIAMMGIADSWIFSAHVVMGIMAENKGGITMLVPGFLSLCCAVVFGPRYAVLLHRIQAPERVSTPSRPPITAPVVQTIMRPDGQTAVVQVAEITPTDPSQGFGERISALFIAHPGLRFLLGIILVITIFQFAFLPPFLPFFLFFMYSFWIPQIWRNARKGNSHALDHRFVVGTGIGRLALPLYVLGCPDNIFFVQPSGWVWGLVIWQWLQISMLFAQERFGAAFFLPKSLAPPESYNYHPLLSTDPESATFTDDKTEKTCSICMEEVDTRSSPSGEVLLGINARRAYALAPCGHLFHTKCLGQWLAVKTICPLCKRSLPPL